VELVFGINYFLFVGYSEYCAFIRVEFHAPFIFPMSQLIAYFILARPLVEYASTVWDPYTQADINKVEAVQRRAARYVASNHRKLQNGYP
jgi:hypothetical protein